MDDLSSLLYRQRNALSWRVISELCRRDTGLYVGLTGGDGSAAHAHSIMVGSASGRRYQARRRGLGFTAGESTDHHIPWERVGAFASAREIAVNLERGAGLSLPAKAPATTPRSLTYRVIAALLTITALDAKVWHDSETEVRPLDPSWDRSNAEGRMLSWEATGWHLQRDGEEMALFDNFGWVRTDRGLTDLFASYKALNRNLHKVVMETFGHTFV